MKNSTIVITGGPGTGKSSVINSLEKSGFNCFPEVSREITAQAQKEGVEQLFLDNPILFSEKLLEARIHQYQQAKTISGSIFLDRGIPDVLAYMNYLGTAYSNKFLQACEKNQYDQIFILPPWKDIYLNDNERYESFEQALEIHKHLKQSYLNLGYKPVEVPKDSIVNRRDFILKQTGL